MDFVLDIATIGLITVAIINRLKSEVGQTPTGESKIKPYWWTVIAFGVGAVLYVISVYAPQVVLGVLFAGLLGSGIYDIYKKQ